MNSASFRPVFIVGCPRSGTTWLYHLLLSAGGFAIYRSETQLYSRFGPAFCGFRSGRQRKSFLDQWQNTEFFHRAGLDEDAFRDTVMRTVDSTGGLLRAFMEGICESQKASRWAECTPDHGLYARKIKRDFPDALFIHINRDGRDVALSLSKQRFIGTLPGHGGKPEIAAAAYWSWISRRISEETAFLGSDLLDVRYDDLVDDLESTLGHISDFVGRPLDLARITRKAIGAVRIPNSSFSDENRPKSLKRGPRWQSNYDGTRLRAVEQLMAPELALFGYPLSGGEELLRRSAASILTRRIYGSRFELGMKLRNLGLSPSRLSSIPNTLKPPADHDPTLRPGQNLQLIRDLVDR